MDKMAKGEQAQGLGESLEQVERNRSVPYHLSHNSRPKRLPAKRADQPDAVLDHQAGACPH